MEDLEEILAGILDYAVAQGLCDDGITARDIFDTRIMGAITPMPREVIRTFREKYAQDPVAATDWYYKFSCDTDYIRRYRIAKDMRWVPSWWLRLLFLPLYHREPPSLRHSWQELHRLHH